MKKISKIGVFFVFFVFILFAFNNNLFAFNFRIDKGKVNINLPPGWSDGGVVNAENLSSEPVKIRVYLGNWEYSNQDGSKNFLPPNTKPNSCVDWIKFYPADFTIPGHGKQKVNFVVGVPQGVSGGYYAVLFFEVEVGVVYDEAKGTYVRVYNRLASLFYVEPEGTIKKEAKLSDFKIRESEGNINLEVNFENTGNAALTAKATFDIITEEGFVLARGQFEDVYTMPKDKAHLLATTLSPGLSKGKYDVILTVDLDGAVLVKEYQIEVSASGRVVGVEEVE